MGLTLAHPSRSIALSETSSQSPTPSTTPAGGLRPEAAPAAEPSDAELLRATAGGDREAFSALVERYERRAFWAAFHLIGEEEEARDVVQEAFVRVFRSLDRYDERRPFYT